MRWWCEISYTARVTQPSDDAWLSTSEAGALLGFHRTTMFRKLSDAAQRERWQLAEGVDWRIKPMTDPPVYQMRAGAVRRLLRSGSPEE